MPYPAGAARSSAGQSGVLIKPRSWVRVPAGRPPAPRRGTRPGYDHLVALIRVSEGEVRALRRARDRIDRDYSRRLTVRSLAEAAGLSPSQFVRRFCQVYGDTPGRIPRRRRMERARELLRADRPSVTQVCLAVGFSSLGSFNSAFTRAVGEGPGATARQHSGTPGRWPCQVASP